MSKLPCPPTHLALIIANGKIITSISEGTPKDVDLAVDAAQKAYDTVWGLNVPGSLRSKLLHKLADTMEKYKEELAALEALDNGDTQRVCFVIEAAKSFDLGKTFDAALSLDVEGSIAVIRYYAGWADKLTGKTIEVDRDLIFLLGLHG